MVEKLIYLYENFLLPLSLLLIRLGVSSSLLSHPPSLSLSLSIFLFCTSIIELLKGGVY